MSASSNPQSRDTILNSFHEISGLNIEDCIHFLEQYNWKLQDIVDDFYNGKDFKNKSTYLQQTSTNNNLNFGDYYAKNDQKQKAIEDDHYYALLIQRFGDGDEFIRNHWREQQQPEQSQRQQSNQDTKNESIYHEKQKYLRCGIHSLNNLFQIPHLFTQEALDKIVREFDKRFINNDYGTLWIGDYDLRILIEAINRVGYQVRQINYFNQQPLEKLPWDSYFGLLININGAHWFTIKNFNGIYYNLDSTFSKPSRIGTKNNLVEYLIRLIHKFDNIYIFSVYK